jgi:hypothetical protein
MLMVSERPNYHATTVFFHSNTKSSIKTFKHSKCLTQPIFMHSADVYLAVLIAQHVIVYMEGLLKGMRIDQLQLSPFIIIGTLATVPSVFFLGLFLFVCLFVCFCFVLFCFLYYFYFFHHLIVCNRFFDRFTNQVLLFC